MPKTRTPIFNNPSMHRLPSIRCGSTILWLDDTDWLACEDGNKNICRLKSLTNNCIIRFKSIAKCRKYVEQAPSYECIIVVAILRDFHDDQKQPFIIVTNLSQLYHYEQVKSILIVLLPTNESKMEVRKNFLAHLPNVSSKVANIFPNYESMLIRLQQILTNKEEYDDGLFATFNRREKSFLDVHEELGVFIWTHSYRGSFYNS